MLARNRAKDIRKARKVQKKKFEVEITPPETKQDLGFGIYTKSGPRIKVGFINRGHRESYIKRHGVFTSALKQFEAVERLEIAKEGFDAYRNARIAMIKEDHLRDGAIGTMPNIKFLQTLKKPHFIDYAKQYDSAVALLKRGYSLTPVSFEALKELNPGLKKTRTEVIKFLESNLKRLERIKYTNRALLVLVKPL